jgi:hypothetical protein
MKSDSGKKNNLINPQENLSSENIDISNPVEENSQLKKRPDLFKLLFRFGFSLLPAVFITGIINGFLSEVVSFSTEFGAPMMIAFTVVIFTAFWVLLTLIGPYKSSHV